MPEISCFTIEHSVMNKSEIAYWKGYIANNQGKPMSDNFYSWSSKVTGLVGWWDKGRRVLRRAKQEVTKGQNRGLDDVMPRPWG